MCDDSVPLCVVGNKCDAEGLVSDDEVHGVVGGWQQQYRDPVVQRAAAVASLSLLHYAPVAIPRDVRRLVARAVWATRRSSAWNPSQPSLFNCPFFRMSVKRGDGLQQPLLFLIRKMLQRDDVEIVVWPPQPY